MAHLSDGGAAGTGDHCGRIHRRDAARVRKRGRGCHRFRSRGFLFRDRTEGASRQGRDPDASRTWSGHNLRRPGLCHCPDDADCQHPGGRSYRCKHHRLAGHKGHSAGHGPLPLRPFDPPGTDELDGRNAFPGDFSVIHDSDPAWYHLGFFAGRALPSAGSFCRRDNPFRKRILGAGYGRGCSFPLTFLESILRLRWNATQP